jgi:DnaK suppressor protein
MNTDQLSRSRSKLEAQLAELESATREHKTQLDDSRTTDDFTGPDRASDLETLEVAAKVAASERRLVEKIHSALERIDLGTYGLCEACGAPIPAARLEAKPSVSLCLRCQEAHETR